MVTIYPLTVLHWLGALAALFFAIAFGFSIALHGYARERGLAFVPSARIRWDHLALCVAGLIVWACT